MADITLADYTSYIFLEIVKARTMADEYSRQMAQVYAQDAVLKYFSVPRFKVPKMELTIPVLVSGARFKEVVRFNMAFEDFIAYVRGLVREVVNTLRLPWIPIVRPGVDPDIIIRPSRLQAPETDEMVQEFWTQLQENADPSQPDTIVHEYWHRIFVQTLRETELEEAYRQRNPNDELFKRTLASITQKVTINTIVDSTRIQSLLVNPETNVVKNGSSDTSVFTIKAELVEEGFFIREIRDDSTGQTRPIVEFE